MIWFIPSFYGDIRLERRAKDKTNIQWENLTQSEAMALEKFSTYAVEKKWTDKSAWPDNITEADGLPPSRSVQSSANFDMDVKLEDARKLLTKLLKPGRRIVDVVSFTDGTFEEVSRVKVPNEGLLDKIAKGAKKVAKEIKAGASVSAPTQGCPEPRLAKADLRAREVLFNFLDVDQREDFESRNAFVTVGLETGHRYMVTSRHAREELAHTRRQLYDLDEKRPYCVHDYTVPAAEEMLAIHLLLQTPGWENYLRHLE